MGEMSSAAVWHAGLTGNVNNDRIGGGADIVRQLMAEDLIDEYYISVILTLLGGGIRLFGGNGETLPLKLVKVQSYDGITDLIYERR